MKCVVALVCVVALLCATSTNARRANRMEHELEKQRMRKEEVSYLQLMEKFAAEGDTLAATPLTPLGTTLDECSPKSNQQEQCQDSVQRLTESTLTGSDPDRSVEDAISGIGEWLKSFKSRLGHSGSSWEAARAAVKPMIDRLKRSQHRTVEHLIDSNREIRTRVEEIATQHIFNLIKASRTARRKADQQALAARQRRELMEEIEDKKAEIMYNPTIISLRSRSGNNSSSADQSALKDALKQEKALEDEVKQTLGV